MKTTVVLLTALFGVVFSYRTLAQNTEIQQLESELVSASGAMRVEKFVALADAYLDAGDLSKAGDYAQKASDLAHRIGRPDLQAIGLNREGKVLVTNGKRGLFGKDLASGKFKESNQILRTKTRPNKALLLDNLMQLRSIAERNKRPEDMADIDGQIARVQNMVENLPMPASVEVGKQPITLQEFKEEMGALSEQINKQQSSQQSAVLQRLNFEKQYAALQAEQAAYKAQIDKMNEDQAKAALAFMQQRFVMDSLKNEANVSALKVTNAELELHQSENKRNFYLAAFVAMLLLAGGATYSFLRARQNARVLEEKNKIIRSEQERSENLLLNILPALVADELKKQGRTSARYFEDVSVLFADFVGFSTIAEKLTPQQLVSELDTCFQAFDEIIAKFNLEKIKTIGDAYMVAGGLPNGGGSQLRDMIGAAREMQSWLMKWNTERSKQKLPAFEARIGIHRGPVVAGVVGSKKFAFDIWGDTVNIAARIEAAGEGGKINVSGEVYEVIKQNFPCQYRGKIPAKNKGEIDMYFVEN